MPGLHRNIIDHEIIETNNKKTLVFVDSSDYLGEPDGPMLEITPPGYQNFFLVNYIARQVTTLNSNTIGFTSILNQSALIDLPDGIWTIKQKVCPYSSSYKIKKFIRFTLLLDKIKTLYENIKLDETKKGFEDDIIKIYILIEGARAVVNIDSDKANANYKLANLLVDKQLNKFCKNCK